MLKKLLTSVLALTSLFSMAGCATAEQHTTPETAMVNLLGEIREYAQHKNPNFQLIGNGAAGLLEETPANSTTNIDHLVSCLDGFLTESAYYTQSENGRTQKQSQEYVAYLKDMFAKVKAADKAVWTLDYIEDPRLQSEDEKKGRKDGYVSIALSGANLDAIPQRQVPFANMKDIYRIQDAQNFLFLLNPGSFSDKTTYLESLGNTEYDVLVIDLYYGNAPLTKEDVYTLKKKPQGGKRLVVAYMSVGEAADYRPYWQEKWNQKRPDWIRDANPAWPGSYKVQYWSPQWKHILYGSDTAYLDQIMNAGFDGVFLDVIDAWQYFAKK